jgi:O-antigen ligase
VHRLQFLTQLVQHPSALNLATLAALGLVALAACYLLSRIDVTVIAVVAIALEMFSGNWSLMGIPLPLDRIVLVVALAALVLKGARFVSPRRLVLRPLHLALLAAAAWAAISGIIAGTISGHLGFFAFLDRFGLVPFVFFALAPVLFGSARQRNILLVALVAIGLYLGITGTLEGLHVYKLVFPRYIANPNVGIQWGRARGPILEATGDGFCTLVGGVAAAIGFTRWRTSWARWTCLVTIGVCGATLFFTLTRSVWIGGFVGVLAAMLLTRRTRRLLVPLGLIGLIAVGGTLVVSSTIRGEAFGRAEQQQPVWDRQNTDLAAIRIIKEYPLTGIGWENFINVSPTYMRQQPGFPITGEGIEVHNVFLSHAAELGIPGLLLWLLGFGGAVFRGFYRKRQGGPGQRARSDLEQELVLWRVGGVAIVACFLVIADLAPFSQALPNTLLWTWLGVMAMPYTSRLRVPSLATLNRQVQGVEPSVGALQPA